jgi:hypothetical protein
MQYSISNIRKINKGVLLASFDLLVGPFIIKDFLVFEKNGENWVSSPSRKYEDSEGQEKYFSYVRCATKEKWESFMNWALDEVLNKVGSNDGPQPTIPQDEDDFPF